MWDRYVLLLLITAVGVTRAASQRDAGKAAGRCKDVRKLQSATGSVALSAGTLKKFDGDVQRILDCLPPRTVIQWKLPVLQLVSTLKITRAVSIHGSRTSVSCPDDGAQPAIEIRASDVSLAGFSFAGCNLTSTSGLIRVEGSRNVTLIDIDFENNVNSAGAACVSAKASSIRMHNVTARNNTGVSGGALFFEKAAEIVVRESVFENNRASRSRGGAIHIKNSHMNVSSSRFSGNLAFDDGGAVFAAGIKRCNLHMEDVVFSGNRVYGEYQNDSNWRTGGGIALVGPKVKMKMQRVVFDENSAPNDGGAILAINGSRILIQDSTFTRNSALQGGAIYIESTFPNVTVLELSGCKFARNKITRSFGTALSTGGALALVSNGTKAMIRDCRFTENRANVNGGAVAAFQIKKVELMASRFLGNRAGQGASGDMGESLELETGGAAWLYEVAEILIVNSRFLRNSARRGGGLHVFSGNLDKAILNITKSTFRSNAAFGNASLSDGGAAALFGASLTCTIGSSIFQKNTAESDGGAVFALGIASLSVSGSSIRDNDCGVNATYHNRQQQPSEDEPTPEFGKLTRGGGVYVEGVPDVTILRSKFTRNGAVRGGGLLSDSSNLENAILTMSGSKFVGNAGMGNVTLSDGGAAALFGQGLRCSIETLVFENNKADFRGGAIFVWRIKTFHLFQCSFSDNFCGQVGMDYGQLPAPEGGTADRRNQSLTYGGAVCTFQLKDISMVNSNFTGNHAGSGGGLFLNGVDKKNKATLSIAGLIFQGNTATGNSPSDGGALALFGATLSASIQDSVFEKNRADGNGGAILALWVAQLSLANSSLAQNTCGMHPFDRRRVRHPPLSMCTH